MKMRFTIGALLSFLMAQTTLASEPLGRILQVNKVLHLEGASSPAMIDYVVSVGTDSGLEKSVILDIYRKIPVSDGLDSAGGASSDLRVWIGQMQVVHAEASRAVARLTGISSPKDHPVVDFPMPLVGDWIEIGKDKRVSTLMERVPGIIFTNKKGSKRVLGKQANKYLAKVTRYISSLDEKPKTIHFIGGSDDEAWLVARILRQNLGARAKSMSLAVHEKPGQKGVAVVLEKTTTP